MISGGRNVKSKSDEELVGLSLKNQEYFGYIIKRYQIKLTRYINRITNVSSQETEDILQEVFIKAYENLNDFDTDLKFSSWIYRITHNEVISRYRKRQSGPQKILLEPNSDFINNIASSTNLDKELRLEERSENIAKVFKKMDIKYREVLILKYLENRSYKEISDIIKKPVNTVGTLISRAKDQFKKIAKGKDIFN